MVISRGVNEGCPLTSTLINWLLNKIVNEADYSDYGMNFNGRTLNNLRFADEVGLIGNLTEKYF